MEYAQRDFSKVRGLKGLADSLIESHLKLYAGYVTNSNLLFKKFAEIKPGVPEWSELRRRMGFEMNGMRLHEFYFEQLVSGGTAPSAGTKDAIAKFWTSHDAWREEFVAMGKMRGTGWVITYRDPIHGTLTNHWINSHEDGHPAGFSPIVIMDVWEHAYTGMERPAYIDGFLANVDWGVVDRRLAAK